MIKKILLFLTVLAILNACAANLYVIMKVNDFSDMPYFIVDVAVLTLIFFLVKRNNLLGIIILIVFACIGLSTAYETDGLFFSIGLLKYAPQVVFTNALEMISILFGLLSLWGSIQRKFQKRGKNNVSH